MTDSFTKRKRKKDKSIDEDNTTIKEELNDFECREHGTIHKKYSKYCETCEKDICIWCKNHQGHNIINYDDIEIEEDKFTSYENNLSKMKKEEKEMRKHYSKIEKLKKEINELNDYINNIVNTIDLINNENKKLIESNEKIIKTYKKGNINNDILKKLNTLSFDLK